MTVCICPDAGKDGHVVNCPSRKPEVNDNETWNYKDRNYVVIRVRNDILIQFDDKWCRSVFYRLDSPESHIEAGMKFVRADREFIAKFRKGRHA